LFADAGRHPMTPAALLEFMRRSLYAVEATVSPTREPQGALVGIIVTEDFEVFFDTLRTSRKAQNLRRDPAIALVIGGTADDADRTVQYEGTADEPAGAELERLQQLYFARFPDGRDRQKLPDVTYFRVKPLWVRYSSFAADPPEVVEFSAEDLRGLSR
jgi:general stress protein 26